MRSGAMTRPAVLALFLACTPTALGQAHTTDKEVRGAGKRVLTDEFSINCDTDDSNRAVCADGFTFDSFDTGSPCTVDCVSCWMVAEYVDGNPGSEGDRRNYCRRYEADMTSKQWALEARERNDTLTIDELACVREIGGEKTTFRVDSTNTTHYWKDGFVYILDGAVCDVHRHTYDLTPKCDRKSTGRRMCNGQGVKEHVLEQGPSPGNDCQTNHLSLMYRDNPAAALEAAAELCLRRSKEHRRGLASSSDPECITPTDGHYHSCCTNGERRRDRVFYMTIDATLVHWHGSGYNSLEFHGTQDVRDYVDLTKTASRRDCGGGNDDSTWSILSMGRSATVDISGKKSTFRTVECNGSTTNPWNNRLTIQGALCGSIVLQSKSHAFTFTDYSGNDVVEVSLQSGDVHISTPEGVCAEYHVALFQAETQDFGDSTCYKERTMCNCPKGGFDY